MNSKICTICDGDGLTLGINSIDTCTNCDGTGEVQPSVQKEMFERSFNRPRNYFQLSAEDQWMIDKHLGILDMDYKLSTDDKIRFCEHYNISYH